MCDERERLLDYLYDACEADERRRVERHLEECEGCRDEISGLRAVRVNLLAWDVPEHGSVWKPFAPARLKPWYREIPVWALAAAASVMFLLGLAGGLISRQFAPVPQVAAVTPAPAPTVTPQVVPTATNADVAAMERRILTVVQTQMDLRLQPVAAHVQTVSAGVSREDLLQEVQRMLATSEQRVIGKLLQDSQRTFVTQSKFNSFRSSELPALVHWEYTQASQQQGSKQ
jgi:hypothetical protein